MCPTVEWHSAMAFHASANCSSIEMQTVDTRYGVAPDVHAVWLASHKQHCHSNTNKSSVHSVQSNLLLSQTATSLITTTTGSRPKSLQRAAMLALQPMY